MKIFGMCLNWKVLAGLAVVAVGLFVVAPQLALSALPILLVLACPLSMLFMMRGMGNMGNSGSISGMQGMQASQVVLPTDRPSRDPLTRDEQIAALAEQLARVQSEQDALTREIAALSSPDATDATLVSVVREAEAVARAAGEQPQSHS